MARCEGAVTGVVANGFVDSGWCVAVVTIACASFGTDLIAAVNGDPVASG